MVGTPDAVKVPIVTSLVSSDYDDSEHPCERLSGVRRSISVAIIGTISRIEHEAAVPLSRPLAFSLS